MGPLRRLEIETDRLLTAHCKLGEHLGSVIRRVARARLQATPLRQFEAQIARLRQSQAWLAAVANSRTAPQPLRQALREYLSCLVCWSQAARLDRCLDQAPPTDVPLSALDLALWLQDDNTGCQTGMLRQSADQVLFWHTEEDTIGYFDRPRLATFACGKDVRHAFLYPYLLPGPAFGWHAGGFHAVDALHICRGENGQATPSFVAAWLVWRLSGEMPIREILEPLAPFLDGCAINTIQRRGKRVTAETHEFGGRFIVSRELPSRAGSLCFQANAVGRAGGRLAKAEALSAAERRKYHNRTMRTQQAVAAFGGEASPDRILSLLASRRGGSYAYANADVKAHCVGVARAGGIELFVQSGAALPGDTYQPQFHA